MTRPLTFAVASLVGLAAIGCSIGEDPNKPPPTPIATDGPNQVVIYVPSMT
jgi:hypothetical protein